MLERLPKEITVLILKFLTFNEQIKVGRVNKRWNEISRNPDLFEILEFEGLSPETNISSKQYLDIIMNILVNVKYVKKIRFDEIQRCHSIDEKHLRYLIIKCPFTKNVKELVIRHVEENKTILAISDFFPSLEKLVIHHLQLESNSLKKIANNCPNLKYVIFNDLNENSQYMQYCDEFLKSLGGAMGYSFGNSSSSFSHQLEHLDLTNCRISASTLKQLLHVKSHQLGSGNEKSYMKVLKLIKCTVTDQAFINILKYGSSLQELSIVAGNLKNMNILPDEIENLKYLKHLSLKANQFSSLCYGFVNLKNLVLLDLSFNTFKEFPLQICGLSSLKTLNLSHNQIETVDSSILFSLTILEELILNNNPQLKKFPNMFDLLSQLKFLKLCDLSETKFADLSKKHGVDSVTYHKQRESSKKASLLNWMKSFFN